MSPKAASAAFALDRLTGRLFWRSPPRNHARRVGTEAGYICNGKGKNKSYWQVRFGGATYKRSHIVFAMANGYWPNKWIDHVNGDSLDDRPENLRECSASQNAQNSHRPPNKSGMPRGVTPCRDKYRARITINGRLSVIGHYATVADASAAYEAKRAEIFNEFA